MIPIKSKGWWQKKYILGDISNIKFDGKIVLSNHTKIKSDLDIKIPPIDFEFSFIISDTDDVSKLNNIKIKPSDKISNKTEGIEGIEYELTNLVYIPRKQDMFGGKLIEKFAETFKSIEAKPETKD